MEPKCSEMLQAIKRSQQDSKRHRNLMQPILQKICSIKYESTYADCDEGARFFDWELKYTGEWSEMMGAGEYLHLYDEFFQPVMLDFNYCFFDAPKKSRAALLIQIIKFHTKQQKPWFGKVNIKNNIARIKVLNEQI